MTSMYDQFTGHCAICGRELPVKLGDYLTNRDEVQVFCRHHIPESDVRIFTAVSPGIYAVGEKNSLCLIRFSKGWCMGIRYLTGNARTHASENIPNVDVQFDVQVKP